MHPNPETASPAQRLLVVSNMWPSEKNPVFGVFVARHVQALRMQGAEVQVVANTDARTGRVAAARKYFSLLIRAVAAARRGRFDAVVGHYLYPTAAIARFIASMADVPLVLVAHGSDTQSVGRADFFGRKGREALSAAALVVTVSTALRDNLRERNLLPVGVQSAVINMGVDDTVFFPRASAREQLCGDADERVVLFAGNLVKSKGIDLLLEAFFSLLDADSADRLILVGEGPLRGWIEQRISDVTVREGRPDPAQRVTLTGRLHQHDLALWMAAADVFVLPSRTEGLGLVLLEAMACGTPCVASRVGGIPEVLDAPACGRLVSPDDAGALAGAIAEVLVSGKDSFGEACIVQASHHSVTAKTLEMIQAIEGVIRR
ncbi:MAG: glycosyltransferase [Actinomycetota bacterium]|nr:glycosyltransferase [Actinomycetota bacterium]